MGRYDSKLYRSNIGPFEHFYLGETILPSRGTAAHLLSRYLSARCKYRSNGEEEDFPLRSGEGFEVEPRGLI